MVHCQKPRFSKGSTRATGLLRPEILWGNPPKKWIEHTWYPIGSMVLLYMVCHGSHQYTPNGIAYIYQHHGSYGYVKCEIQRKSWYINIFFVFGVMKKCYLVFAVITMWTQSVSGDKKTQVDYWSEFLIDHWLTLWWTNIAMENHHF